MNEPVYSTAGGSSRPKKDKKSKGYQRGQGPAKMRIEKKGRGGKVVTVLSDLPMNHTEAKALMKELQGHLACGATLKDSQIELRGDNQEALRAFFQERGEKLKG